MHIPSVQYDCTSGLQRFSRPLPWRGGDIQKSYLWITAEPFHTRRAPCTLYLYRQPYTPPVERPSQRLCSIAATTSPQYDQPCKSSVGHDAVSVVVVGCGCSSALQFACASLSGILSAIKIPHSSSHILLFLPHIILLGMKRAGKNAV